MSQSQQHTESDDDDYRLPADTLLILQQFLSERELREKTEETGEVAGSKGFEENWVCMQLRHRKQFFFRKESICSNLASFGIIMIQRKN